MADFSTYKDIPDELPALLVVGTSVTGEYSKRCVEAYSSLVPRLSPQICLTAHRKIGRKARKNFT